MGYKKNNNAILAILNEIGIDEEDRTEVVELGCSENTYYQFKVYDTYEDDLFRLGSLLGEAFGDKNMWIDTYKHTAKYRGFSKIEIKTKTK
jgi:hypothetical protein